MTVLHASHALTPTGWQADVRLTVTAGRFSAVEAACAPEPGDTRVAVLVPGLPNLHSHAFQRGMAGLAERRGPSADTFWTWRETMYRFALRMSPDEAEAVAAQAYVEMLESGFTRVGEFHYLHHAPDGAPYAQVAEMAERIAAAAALTGLRLTLLPVLYRWSNFGGVAPTDGQRRFVSDLDLFARMVDASRTVVAGLPGATLGVAPHSLRAVTPEDLSAAAALAEGGPIHIHAAEQVREVEDSLSWSGARPVQWLLDQAGLDSRWCLIHATHMTPDETTRFATSGAVAGLCPVTEASLGDGIFPGPGFVAAGGRYGVGTDSNVLVGAADELRQLEYAQRLGARQRNVLAAPGASTGRALFDAGLAGGTQALAAEGGGLAVGAPADGVALDGADPALIERRGDALLDGWIFAAGARAVDAVWVDGRQVVAGGRHVAREAVAARYARVLGRLMAA
ncbi:formimidoylglutamate deiminase [Methylobacterium indicum]|uniref:N-formimino-L-glutamate deiminase n=1 Tax=Methylobacterium indicum TaxID=1775910 RepID=A0ABR5GVT0_9HYPH|nr:formimidoylglutamate deiminase [Methylobacterium indicum]KMO13898.1 N-formimino-L-glutamate deiminase [Methylobacterium indicum]KMO20669.1 N-formimino-L-glutamate deiminase [Methylobacterium indicum]